MIRKIENFTFKNEFWFSKKCQRCRNFIFRYLVVLGICWLPDKVTLILNLTHLLNLDAELCYSWRLICNILIMLNGSLNPGCVFFYFLVVFSVILGTLNVRMSSVYQMKWMDNLYSHRRSNLYISGLESKIFSHLFYQYNSVRWMWTLNLWSESRSAKTVLVRRTQPTECKRHRLAYLWLINYESQ